MVLAAEAESRLNEAIRRAPSQVEPRLWLAAALDVQGKKEEALQALFDAMRIDLENRDAALGAANLLFDVHSNGAGTAHTLADAIDMYRKADAVSPLDARALARLAAALSQLGHLEPAEAALKRAAALEPANQDLAQSLKNIDDARKRSGSIEQQAVALLKKNPLDPNGLRLVAQAHALRGNQLAASYALDTAWRTGAADFPTWVLTGFVWARLGATDNFVRDHATPPAKSAETPFAWAELARACASSGMWDAAESYLQSPPAQAEQSTAPNLILADIAQQLNQSQRAQQYREKAAGK
jgi:tetratricopeptide (TPR) repeat protein